MIKRLVYLILPLLLAGTVHADSDKVEMTPEESKELQKWIAGRIVGEPQKCLYRQQFDDMVVINERIFLFGTSRTAKTIYINKTHGACKDAKKYTIVFRKASETRLCRGDNLVVVNAGLNMPKGGCHLTDFVPLKLVK